MNLYRRIGLTTVAMASVVAIYGTGAIAMERECHEHAVDNECGCNKEGHHDYSMILKKELKLSGKQAGEISDIMEEEIAKAKPLFDAIQKERKELILLTLTIKTDAAGIKAQAAKLAEAESALALHHAHVHKRIAGVMTSEQAAKFEELSKKFAEHIPGPGGPFMGRADRNSHHSCEQHEEK